MKAEDFYKKQGYPEFDKFDKKAPKFDYYDFIDFAESFHQAKLKEEEEKDFVCGIVRNRCDVQCYECKNDI